MLIYKMNSSSLQILIEILGKQKCRPNTYTIDDKNINLQTKNMFFHFYKKHFKKHK